MLVIFLGMAVVALGFIFVAPILLNFVTEGGQRARKLCLLNSAGWLLIVALASGQDNFWMVFTAVVFWLGNLILLPAALLSLKAGYVGQEENHFYLATTLTYLLLNMLVLFFLPLVLFVHNAIS